MSFRKMRRSRQELSREETLSLIARNTSGVLAVLGDDGYPYTVPLNYYFENNCFYFHCADKGHKIDAIATCDKVSFCIKDTEIVVPEEFTSYFRSVIAFGRATIISDKEELLRLIERFALHFCPNESIEHRQKAIDAEFHNLRMIKMDVEHLCGKQCIEYVAKVK